MLLSARFLNNVCDANTFNTVTQLTWTQGDAVDVYFQLIDISVDLPNQGFSPAGRRYVPAPGATLQASVNNIDNSKKVTRAAVQPFVGDASIWKISILPTDTSVTGTGNLYITLTEGSKVTRGYIQAAFLVINQSNQSFP